MEMRKTNFTVNRNNKTEVGTVKFSANFLVFLVKLYYSFILSPLSTDKFGAH